MLWSNGEMHAFMWSNGLTADLGTLGGANSAAVAVNSGGTAVGVADPTSGSGRAVARHRRP